MADADDVRSGEELLTLSEVSNRTGISMPTLQRYKKSYQNRIPSVGKGRKQRYPVSSLSVFQTLKEENIAKRGRPRKKRSQSQGETQTGRRGGRRPGRRGGARRERRQPSATNTNQDLLTLTEVAERTGISYPTLVRYVKMYGNRIPFEGKGRRRRYHPEAVEVFNQIRAESPRGRRKGSGSKAGASRTGSAAASAVRGSVAGDGAIGRRLQALERSQEKLAQEIRELVRHLKKPMTATFHRK